MSAAIDDWFATRVPDEWHAQGVEVVADQDEILVVVDLAGGEPGHTDHHSFRHAGPASGPGPSTDEAGPSDESGSAATGESAGGSRSLTGIRLFREVTRDERMALARGAEQAFGRKVSWGARIDDTVVVFTTVSVPVMTRLRMPERRVLDTLIDAGVARSRSEALAWCVRLVGDNEKEWVEELRAAFEAVEAARACGPRSRTGRAARGKRG